MTLRSTAQKYLDAEKGFLNWESIVFRDAAPKSDPAVAVPSGL